MGKLPIKLTNERREQVWHLLLKGNNAQQIKKILNISNATVHRDIKFLTTKSKEYMHDMAKGLHVLAYQRAIEGIGLTLTEAWAKFNDPKVPEKQKVSYLRLTRECNESIINLTEDGPAIMGIQHMTAKARRIGITAKYPPLPNPESLTEDQLADDYEKSGTKKSYIPYEGIGIEDDINNPEGLPDTSEPNDFPDEPELVTSGCFRRYGDYSYSHIQHKLGEYCYLRDKEEKEKAKWHNNDNENDKTNGDDE